MMIHPYSFYYVSFLTLVEKSMRLLHIPEFFKTAFYKIKRNYIRKIIQKIHNGILEEKAISDLDEKTDSFENIIWVCWLQGEDKAPEIVRRCIANLRLYNSYLYKVVVVDLANFENYTTIPTLVLDKFHKGIISNTHFSDILRFNLLMNNGGLWIDATYLTLGSLPEIIHKKSFFTLASENFDNKFVPVGRWSGNFIKFQKNDLIPYLMCRLFEDYWTKNYKLIDYFLIDHYLSFLYDNINKFKVEIDSNIRLGDNCFFMGQVLFKPYNPILNENILMDSVKIYKLSYKIPPAHAARPNTFYQHYVKNKF